MARAFAECLFKNERMDNTTYHEVGAAVFDKHQSLILACCFPTKDGNVHQRSNLTDLSMQSGHNIRGYCASINIKIADLAIETRLLGRINLFTINLAEHDTSRYFIRCLSYLLACIKQIGLQL